MAGMTAKLVLQYFESQDVKAQQLEDTLIRAGWDFEGGSLMIFLDFDESETHVHLEGIDFMKVPENKFSSMYEVINDCNDLYSHIKFVLDKDHGQIVARDDDVISLDTCGPECFELMIRMMKVVEDAYPKFMKALWA